MKINRDSRYKTKLAELREIFKNVEEDKRLMVDNILQDYAFLYVDNLILKEMIRYQGSVILDKGIPKKSEAAMQYQRNSNTMNMHTRTLMIMLRDQDPDSDDPLDKFLKSKKQ